MSVNILTFGSCRIHGPMREIAATKRSRYFSGGSCAYLHSAKEAVQRLQWGLGEITIDNKFAPYSFSTDKTPKVTPRIKQQIMDCEILLAEISSAKELVCQDVYLQLNYFHRNLVSELGALGTKWWRELMGQGFGAPATIEKILRSSSFRTAGFGDFEAVLLRETRCVSTKADQLKEILLDLKKFWHKPIVIVSHVGLPLMNGNFLKDRIEFIRQLKETCGALDITCFEPATIIDQVGRSCALDREGEDIDHYSGKFEPIYGWYLLNRVIKPAMQAS